VLQEGVGGKGGRWLWLTNLPPSFANYLKPGSLNLLKPTWRVKVSPYFRAVFLDMFITLDTVHCLIYVDLEKPEKKGKILSFNFTALFKYVYLTFQGVFTTSLMDVVGFAIIGKTFQPSASQSESFISDCINCRLYECHPILYKIP
jgi:hypothetical protein